MEPPSQVVSARSVLPTASRRVRWPADTPPAYSSCSTVQAMVGWVVRCEVLRVRCEVCVIVRMRVRMNVRMNVR
jgi:hypothetical protein